MLAGPKWVFAPLLGVAGYAIGMAMVRSMARGGAHAGPPEPVTDIAERTLYWCPTCGTEVLLLVRGTGAPPRHCGEKMHERAELGA